MSIITKESNPELYNALFEDNLDWTHHDSKTINENYYQVIEGTRSWGKTYTVNLFEKQLEEKDKEIEILNNEIKTLLKENEAKEKVIKKQDYVINELEKWLIEYRTFIDIPDYYEEGIIDCLDEVLDKLKELKENRDEK